MAEGEAAGAAVGASRATGCSAPVSPAFPSSPGCSVGRVDGDECPWYPGTRYLDWPLEDPAGQGIDAVRPIRDRIRANVEQLIADLLPRDADRT